MMLVNLQRPSVFLLGIVAVILVALLALACGGGDGEGGDANGSEIDPEAQALLEKMVLQEDDLPDGLAQLSTSFSTNEDLAGDSEAELAKLEGWGRRLAYDLQFVPGPDAPIGLEVQGVQNTVSLYRTAQGASDSFADGVMTGRNTDWPAIYPDVREVEAEEIEPPGLGDERVWFHITGLDPSDRMFVDDQLVLRVGPVRSFLRVVAVFDSEAGRDAHLNQVEAWARLVAGRVAAALAE